MSNDKAEDIANTCKDYKVTPDAFRVAAVAELLAGDHISKKASIRHMTETLSDVLDDVDIINVVRWATWVEHARKNGLNGADITSLLELRRKKNGSKTVRRSD